LRPKCDLLVSKFAFKCNLYRYTGAGGGRCAGIIVDVFDEHSRVLPLLTQVETWRDIASALAPGGRVVANLSTGRGEGADLGAAVAAAEAAAVACGGGEAFLWRSGARGIWNEVVLTGPPPVGWAERLPPQLRHLAGDWHHIKAPPGVEQGWLMGGS
jgi:spermidine synthase